MPDAYANAFDFLETFEQTAHSAQDLTQITCKHFSFFFVEQINKRDECIKQHNLAFENEVGNSVHKLIKSPQKWVFDAKICVVVMYSHEISGKI